MKEVHKTLGEFIPLNFFLITGSGTNSIYLALKALGLNNSPIAVPNNVCYSVPIGVLLSGNYPVYIDVELSQFGLSIDSLKMHLSKIKAVIAVHAFGNVSNIEAIQSFCKTNHIPLIEDCATALGSRKNGILTGGYGDITIYSFGAGKIIDVDHGGAVSTNDPKLANELNALNRGLPLFSSSNREGIKQVGSTYKKLYNTYFLSGQFDHLADFRSVFDSNQDHFLFQFSPVYAPILLRELSNLESNIISRRNNADNIYDLLKEDSNIILPVPDYGSAIWRFNAFINNGRNELFKQLIKKNYKVSTWFPSISQFFNQHEDTIHTPNSDWVGGHILNLWVNSDIDDNYIKNVCNDILEYNSTHKL